MGRQQSSVKDLAAAGHGKVREGDVGGGTLEVITAAIYGNGGLNEFGEKAAVWRRVLELPVEDGLLEGCCAAGGWTASARTLIDAQDMHPGPRLGKYVGELPQRSMR